MGVAVQLPLVDFTTTAMPPSAVAPTSRLPHPIPYQGSKRTLAHKILAVAEGRKFQRFYEPFAGSAAMTLAAARAGLAEHYIIADSLAPLVEIWRQIIAHPQELADAYERVWNGQLREEATYYNRIRDEFNRAHDPAKLLYLLARCVKNSPRFNQQGEFNQSPDKRRLGMQPTKMRRELMGAAGLLAGRTTVVCGDFETIIANATSADIIYMDPPYEGTSTGGDKRYHQGLLREHLIAALINLNKRNVPFLLSYDGRCGTKVYGPPLPESLGLLRLELHAGRSTQATLNGKADVTVESLYVSPQLL